MDTDAAPSDTHAVRTRTLGESIVLSRPRVVDRPLYDRGIAAISNEEREESPLGKGEAAPVSGAGGRYPNEL